MSILGNENVPLSLSEFQIFDRILERNIASDELQEYVDYALVIFNQWNEKRKLFIFEKGLLLLWWETMNGYVKQVWGILIAVKIIWLYWRCLNDGKNR